MNDNNDNLTSLIILSIAIWLGIIIVAGPIPVMFTFATMSLLVSYTSVGLWSVDNIERLLIGVGIGYTLLHIAIVAYGVS